MFQKIVESENIQDFKIHCLENGSLISAFEVDLLDEELLNISQCEDFLLGLLKDLPMGRTLKIYLKSEYSNVVRHEHSRVDAIKELGHIKNKAVILLEKPVGINFFSNRSKNKKTNSLLFDFQILKDANLRVKSLDAEELSGFFPKLNEELCHSFQSVDLGTSNLSIIRLVKQSEFGISLASLSKIKDQLPLPYMICCAIQTVPQATAETHLRRRSKQNENSNDLKTSRKFSEAQNDLEDISLNGSRFYRFEWQCLIERKNEIHLREDREETKRKLQPLGEMYIESVGALKSLRSFYPGESPHCSLLEKDQTLISYIPLITRGDAQSKKYISLNSLALHRLDESLTYLDIFDPRYESFSWCIFGRPGTGKSVLTNAITRSLLFNPKVRVIKIDVGGSHTRETQMLGGVEKTLNLNEPTGINPFSVLTEIGNSKEALQILASFLEVLILEENEIKLNKTMKSDLEKAVFEYAVKNPIKPTLEDFYNNTDKIPRRELLRRWVGTGVYGNAFSSSSENCMSKLNILSDSRLIYYNFSKISQAIDPDFAQGGLAAVMAQFNLEMLKKSQNKNRIVFIADETPFFIKKCFSFFNLSIANVRKEGHGFITIAQKSAHVVIDSDTGILDNSPNKIFFSLDGDEESFIARTQTDLATVEKIKSLKRKQGEYSEALWKDNLGERIIRIRLSPFEYWAYTSKDEDRQKLQEIQQACPSLQIEEIIRCLSL